MGPLNDEKKLQVDKENNKNEEKKLEKPFKMYDTINFKTIR